jgi:hypothetical protein
MIGMGTTIFLVNPTTFGGSSFTNEKSLLFDGVDEYVSVSTVSELSNVSSFSISVWMKDITGTNEVYVSQQKNSTNNIQINKQPSGPLRFQVKNGSANHYVEKSGLTYTGWHHYVCVFDGTQGTSANRLKIYYDGVDQSATAGGTLPTTSPTFTTETFQMMSVSAAVFASGNMDEPAVFNYALDSTQVTSLYNSGAPTDLDNTSGVTAPNHWWRMGDGDTFPTITDVGTTAGNDGTMTNQESGDIVSDVPS